MSKNPPGCDYTYIGKRDGIKIEAATDFLGPQVIVGGDDAPMHRLSPAQESHEEAVKLGKKVLAEGFDLCKDWIDLRDEGLHRCMERLFFWPGGKHETR